MENLYNEIDNFVHEIYEGLISKDSLKPFLLRLSKDFKKSIIKDKLKKVLNQYSSNNHFKRVIYSKVSYLM